MWELRKKVGMCEPENTNANWLSNLLSFVLIPEFVWAPANSFDTFACGGCEGSCCAKGTGSDHMFHKFPADIPDIDFTPNLYNTAGGIFASSGRPGEEGQFNGGHMFRGADVGDIPDVTDPKNMTDYQQSMSARLLYTDTSEFVLAFGRDKNAGLRIQFAGYTNVGEDICTTPTTQSPTQSPTTQAPTTSSLTAP